MLGLIIFSVSFSYIWIHKLLDPDNGLLAGFAQNIYDLKFGIFREAIFFCNVCLSGWICLSWGFLNALVFLLLGLNAMAFTAVMAGIYCCFISMLLSDFLNHLKTFLTNANRKFR